MVTAVRAAPGRSLFLVIAAASVITSTLLGVRSTFGLYLEPVIDTLGTDRGTYALAIAIQNIVWGASQPVAGAVADRFGSARVLAAGAVGYMASMMLLATAETTGLLILSAGFLVGVSTGAASFAVVLSAVGRLVSEKRRSMALGIVTAMGSVGQFVLIPTTQRLLDATSWQRTVTILGFVVLSAALFTRPFRGRAVDQIAEAAGSVRSNDDSSTPTSTADTEERTLRDELRRAANHRSYVLLNMAFFVCGFHVTFIGTHLPSYVSDLGLASSVAATALALIGLFNIAGSLTAGVLGGRFSKTRLLSFIYAARAVVIAGYVLLPASATTTIVFGAVFGLLWLSTVPLTSGIVTGQFGTRHSGALFGIVFFSLQLGAFVGVWLGGELADATGSYRAVWFIALALGIVAAVLHLMIDEGPAPEAPLRSPAGIGLAPAGAAAIAVIAGVSALVFSTRAASADDPEPSHHEGSAAIAPAGHSSAAGLFCPLHVS